MIRLPDFVGEEDFSWAMEAAEKKKKLDCSRAYLLALDEAMSACTAGMISEARLLELLAGTMGV